MNPLLSPAQPNAARTVAETIEMARLQGARMLRENTLAAFNAFWHSPDATPAEIAAEFGTSCKTLFDEHRASIAMLLGRGVQIPESEYTPPLPFTENEDGTVTIGG